MFASNLHVFDAIGIVDENGFGSAFGSFHVRRKQSAALDFDLVAARAGDKVQALRINPEELIDCTPLLHERIYTGRCTGNESIPTKEFGWYDQKFLRMKHPRRVGVDYSQFED